MEEDGNADEIEGEDEDEAAAKEGRKSSSDKSGAKNAWPLCFSSEELLELDCQLDDDWKVSGSNGSGEFEEDASTGALWLADTSNAGIQWEEPATAAVGWVGR